jgi:hypothetical protein
MRAPDGAWHWRHRTKLSASNVASKQRLSSAPRSCEKIQFVPRVRGFMAGTSPAMTILPPHPPAMLLWE